MTSVDTFLNLNRLKLSRVFGLLLLALLLTRGDYWESFHHDLVGEAMFTLGVPLAVTAAFGRLWCLSHIVGKKGRVLVAEGPYSLCRHPLYFFTLLSGVGLALCSESLTVVILVSVAFGFYYVPVIRREEAVLVETVPGYEAYRRAVPAFLPRWTNFVPASSLSITPHDFVRAATESALPLCALAGLELIETLHGMSVLPAWLILP